MELSKKKTYWFNFLILAGVFLLLLGLLEVYLRLEGRTSDNFLKQDGTLGWVHLSNKKGWSVTNEYRVPVRLNNFGLVGPDATLEKPADTFRIAVLGDSFTEAFQVEPESSYVRVVEKRLNDLGNSKKVEVLNFGVTSYGTVKEEFVLKNKVLRFNPDLVIVGFFVGNDYSDNLREEIHPGFVNSFPFPTNLNSAKLWVRNHSVAYRWFLEKKARNQFFSNPTPVSTPAIYKPNSIFRTEYSSPAVQEGMEKTQLYLKEMSSTLQQYDVNFLLLILPSKDQVHEGPLAPEDQNLNRENKPNEALKEFLEKEKIAYLDALPFFQSWAKINPKGLAFFKFDGHPNETGHFLIAKGLLEYLQKHNYGEQSINL